MDLDIIEEIVDILKEDEGAMIPRPATEKDIFDCNKNLVELGLELLPQGYTDFLAKYNGLSWNGIEFYSTDQVVEADNPDGYRLMDLVTMNDEFNDEWEFDEKVLLGRDDEWYFTYNIETKKYEITERGVQEALEVFDSFEALFYNEVGGRLGLFDDSEDSTSEGF